MALSAGPRTLISLGRSRRSNTVAQGPRASTSERYSALSCVSNEALGAITLSVRHAPRWSSWVIGIIVIAVPTAAAQRAPAGGWAVPFGHAPHMGPSRWTARARAHRRPSPGNWSGLERGGQRRLRVGPGSVPALGRRPRAGADRVG